MFKTNLGAAAEAMGGTLLAGECGKCVSSVSTDSRKITEGCLFFALAGERFDGHAYVEAALMAGAAAAVVSRTPDRFLHGKAYILVEDTRLALGALAHSNRMRAGIPLVAVTGSVGKTTAKDVTAAVLSQRFRVLKTPKNLNNDIGMPLTLLELDERHEAAVIEMGMNHFGELSYLSRIAMPSLAIITNIGDAHIENLGSREGILRAKCEVLEGMEASAPIVFNADDELLMGPGLESAAGHRVIRCGRAEKADVRAFEDRQQDYCTLCRLSLGGRTVDVRVQAAGEHMVWPVAMASAVGLELGLSVEDIVRGLEEYIPDDERMSVQQLGGVTLLRDCYNANPQSMAAALKTLAQADVRRRVAVLGDMFELGHIEKQSHRGVGRLAAELGIDEVICIGERSRETALGAEGIGCSWFESFEAAQESISRALTPGTAVLVKASHGMHFERVAEFIRARLSTNEGQGNIK